LKLHLILIGVILLMVFLILFVIGAIAVRASEAVIDMRDFREGDLVVDGFTLDGRTTLSISAIGAELKHSDDMYATCWILDSREREAVWVLTHEDTEPYRKDDYLREFNDEITLSEGSYEAYYYAGRPYFLEGSNITINDFGDAIEILKYIFEDDEEKRYQFYSENIEALEFVIKAPEGSFTKFDPVENLGEDVIVEFARAGDDYYQEKGFTLKEDMDIRITGVGEYSKRDRFFVDYGWIIDADSRKKVWQMDRWNTSWAGGGRKNRAFKGEVELPAGNYIAYFATDDSHAFGSWNVPPPYDPLVYGMIIYAEKGRLEAVAEYVDDYTEPLILNITEVRDNDYEFRGLSLEESKDFHIVALGEFGYDGHFVDYGWIENLDNQEVVWKMHEDNTDHAGGAAKNRKFDGIVTLPAGNYVVYYISDDSHSYRRWNAAAPIRGELWGISLYGAGKDFDSDGIDVFQELPENTNILVNLVGLGDDEEVRVAFELDKAQRVHIFALGEGRDGDMYDYGWIEDARTGDIIWEMTYRKTFHAGGDDKNRMVDTQLFLDKGKYYVFFVTDDSHSFPDFNASRPTNPQKWGIQVTKK